MNDSSKTIPFFVYGTLKKGYGNHRIIEGAFPLGPGTVKGMAVYDGPGFPYATLGEPDEQVVGEVYACTPEMARRMDILEGYPHHYDRAKVNVLVGEEKQEAWMYFHPNRKEVEKFYTRIPEGVWGNDG